MKKLLLASASLCGLAGLIVLVGTSAGRAQPPASQEPFSIPLGKPAQSTGGYLPTTPGSNKLPEPAPLDKNSSEPKSGSLREYLRQKFDEIDINQDLAITPQAGAWVICLNVYTGPNAPQMARKLALEVRTNPAYKLPAYIFTKGAEERRAELMKARDTVEKMLDFYKKNGYPEDTPFRLGLTRYEIQCAVMVGGFRDMDEASRANERFKKLPDMDPKAVDLHAEMVVNDGKSPAAPSPSAQPVQLAFIQPFKRGMVGCNPTVKQQHPTANSADDLALLRRLNEDEPFSLLKSPHKYTLVVKEFKLPRSVVQSQSSGVFSGKTTSGTSTNTVDAAASNAHEMAKFLRDNCKQKAFVLHTKYASFVTIGEYDDVNDPRIPIEQERLPLANQQLHQEIQFLPRPAIFENPK